MELQNPDSMMVSQRDMAAAIAGAESRIMASVAQTVADASGEFAGDSGVGEQPQSVYTPPPSSPFMVYWDDDEEAWKMYLPEGSLVVNGKTVSVDEPDSIESGDTLYLHIKKSGTEAEISTDATQSGYQWHVKIAEIASNDDEGEYVKMQYLCGALVIGGSGGSGDVLEPEYDDESGEITGVKNPYVLVGRQYVSVSGTPSEGTNVLKIEHSSDTVTASIVSGSMPPNSPTLTTSYIALYKIEDNAITEDYRNLLTLPMYDPKD